MGRGWRRSVTPEMRNCEIGSHPPKLSLPSPFLIYFERGATEFRTEPLAAPHVRLDSLLDTTTGLEFDAETPDSHRGQQR
jgi:hypothetical protein